MTYSIVVTFHSGLSFLRLCLESLIRTTAEDVEIIVVMNNADERQINVDLAYPRIREVRIKETLGYAAAANAGVTAARGKVIIFADQDMIFTDGWFEALCVVHFHSSRIGATSVRIVNPHSLRVLDFGIGFTRLNSPHPHLDQRLESPLVNHPRRVQAMCTGGFMIERHLFEQIGGFDPDLDNFYTDIDLCLRLKDADRECWSAADAVAYHFGGDFSQIDRSYKASFLKADLKAWFRAKNHHRITIDMDHYYNQSWRYFRSTGPEPAENYVACCLMNVADLQWYLDVMRQYLRLTDVAKLPSGRRDSGTEGLYEMLGYDFLTIRAPIAYFVDRFVSLANNQLWWRQRADVRDIIIDRHGNILRVADL